MSAKESEWNTVSRRKSKNKPHTKKGSNRKKSNKRVNYSNNIIC